ncbi:MAG: hypothetical protein ACN4GW_03995 [Desulforhopalus sp.]
MKYLFILMSIGIAGSCSYKEFIGTTQQDFLPAETSSLDYLPPIPQQCEDLGESLEDTIYDHELGKVTIIELSQFTRRFQSCLLAAGFTDPQVYRTFDGIAEVALNTDPDNSGDGRP